MAHDPICGMTVDETTALKVERNGGTVYFCSAHCRDKFLKEPSLLKHSTRNLKSTSYTCPMHLEIQQDHPGDCPKCGMALEPMEATGEEDDSELRDMTRRFWIGLGVTLPVFIIAMGGHIPGDPIGKLIPSSISKWIEFLKPPL